MKTILLAALCGLAISNAALAQEWSGQVRGSWVRAEGAVQPGDVTLTNSYEHTLAFLIENYLKP